MLVCLRNFFVPEAGESMHDEVGKIEQGELKAVFSPYVLQSGGWVGAVLDTPATWKSREKLDGWMGIEKHPVPSYILTPFFYSHPSILLFPIEN